MIREEIAPYVKITQRNSDLPIKEAPQMETLDAEGLCNNCPLLKSCYVECLRLDTASWSLKIVKQDFVLQSREKDAQGWLLKKGDYAHVAHDLHNTDPRYFDGPEVWKADRHIRIEGEGSEKKAVVDMGSIRPYGESVRPFRRVQADSLDRWRPQHVQRSCIRFQREHDVHGSNRRNVGHRRS